MSQYKHDLNNIYFENNKTIQYIKHSNYIQDSETSNYDFINLSPTNMIATRFDEIKIFFQIVIWCGVSWNVMVSYSRNCIVGVMVSVLVSSVVDRRFEPRSGQAKDYKIGSCCFSAKHTASKRKNKDWLARNQNIVSEWSDMFTRGLLFQWACNIKIQLSMLV